MTDVSENEAVNLLSALIVYHCATKETKKVLRWHSIVIKYYKIMWHRDVILDFKESAHTIVHHVILRYA